MCRSVKDLVCTKANANDASSCKFVFSEGTHLSISCCSVKDLTCTEAKSNDKPTCDFVFSEGLLSTRRLLLHSQHVPANWRKAILISLFVVLLCSEQLVMPLAKLGIINTLIAFTLSCERDLWCASSQEQDY